MADITYIPAWAVVLYVAVVLDAWSRRVVGWAMPDDWLASGFMAPPPSELFHQPYFGDFMRGVSKPGRRLVERAEWRSVAISWPHPSQRS